jgi:ADP-ribose pyrophosphatase YjhB (NUDIX family)
MEVSLESYAEEIEAPETSWERVREILESIGESEVRPKLIEVAIGIIHNEAEERLLLKRSADDRSFPSTWCFPGGRRDWIIKNGKARKKEPLNQTIKREVFEETSLETKIEQKIAVRRAVHLVRARIYIVHSYLLNVVGDPHAIQLSREHEEYGYFARGAAPEKLGTVTQAMFDWEPGKQA